MKRERLHEPGNEKALLDIVRADAQAAATRDRQARSRIWREACGFDVEEDDNGMS
jgi:hypothetical protein